MTASKIVAAAASGAAGGPTDVDDVFSCHVHIGTGGARSITNNINLSGEGGLVWFKQRDANRDHGLFDTERGTGKYLVSNDTNAEASTSTMLSAFNSDGFSIAGGGAITNNNNNSYVSWTFRKAEKFFDIVTWTGDGTGARTFSHNLGCDVGMILVKRTSSTEDWTGYHRGSNSGVNPETYKLLLNSTNGQAGSSHWNSTAPTATNFRIATYHNVNNETYVAYLFAHNNGNGEFGPDGDQDIIKCDSYTTSNSGTGTITLGFEPQFILRKRVDSSQNWGIFDASRGIYDNNDYILYPNLTNAEASAGNQYNATGNGFSINEHAANATYIYVAIRRGPLAAPDDATKVFSQTSFSGNSTDNRIITSGFQTDLVIHKRRSAGASWFLADRKRGGRGALFLLFTDGAQAQNDYSNYLQEIDLQDGVELGSNGDINGSGNTYINYQWKRAPSFCDITVHKSNGQPTQQIPHNLGVVPEMVWIKSINDSNNWFVHHKDLTSGKNLLLNSTSAETTSNSTTAAAFNATYWTPGDNGVLSGGGNNVQYVAYLFATVAGISKVGSVNINSTSNFNVDCGFSNGARFVMVKAFNQSAPWYVSDSVRGINAASADPLLFLNDSQAENTASDWIEPYSAGFTIKGNFYNGYNLIFYAIA
jgi:hypothetical protein